MDGEVPWCRNTLFELMDGIEIINRLGQKLHQRFVSKCHLEKQRQFQQSSQN